MSNSIGQLLKAWSDVDSKPDPSNLRGLQLALKNLAEKPNDTELKGEIVLGAASLTRAFQQAIAETEADAAKLPDHSPIHELFEYTLNAYHMALEITEQIRQDRDALVGDSLIEILEDLDEAMGEIESDQSHWADWLASTEPRCTKCGFDESGHSMCPHCKVEMLVPDSRSPETSNNRQAVLGPEYVKAYHAYRSLQAGEISLTQFFQFLRPLEQTVRQQNMLVTQGGLKELAPNLADTIIDVVQRGLNGLKLIHSAAETRMWSHINDGWDAVFNAAVDMQNELPNLYRTMGQQSEAEQLEQSLRVRDTA